MIALVGIAALAIGLYAVAVSRQRALWRAARRDPNTPVGESRP